MCLIMANVESARYTDHQTQANSGNAHSLLFANQLPLVLVAFLPVLAMSSAFVAIAKVAVEYSVLVKW